MKRSIVKNVLYFDIDKDIYYVTGAQGKEVNTILFFWEKNG